MKHLITLTYRCAVLNVNHAVHIPESMIPEIMQFLYDKQLQDTHSIHIFEGANAGKPVIMYYNGISDIFLSNEITDISIIAGKEYKSWVIAPGQDTHIHVTDVIEHINKLLPG